MASLIPIASDTVPIALGPVPIPAGNTFSIGRSEGVSFHLPELDVSRVHCTIQKKEEDWVIIDKSSMGTLLNKKKLEKGKEISLNDGNKIKISTFTFIFCTGDSCTNNCHQRKKPRIDTSQSNDHNNLKEQIRKSIFNVEELQVLQKELNTKLSQKMHGLDQRFELESKSQTPDEVARLKKQVEDEKAQIRDQYAKEIEELGRRLQQSEDEQNSLRQQIDYLFEERGRSADDIRSLATELDESKLKCQQLAEQKTELENRLQASSEAAQAAAAQAAQAAKAAAQNTRKECLGIVNEALESELQCCICSELLMRATILNCRHSYCYYCIMSWLKNNNVCPMCRANVTTKTESLSIDGFIDKIIPNLPDDVKERRIIMARERAEATRKFDEARSRSAAAPQGQANAPDVVTIRDGVPYFRGQPLHLLPSPDSPQIVRVVRAAPGPAVQVIQPAARPVSAGAAAAAARVAATIRGATAAIRVAAPPVRAIAPAPAARASTASTASSVRAQAQARYAGARPRAPPPPTVIDLTSTTPTATRVGRHRRHARRL